MFDFSFDAATKKTAGQLAVGSGIALLVYNKFERPREGLGLPLALIGGGTAVLALTSSEGGGGLFGASGPQEEKDLAAIKADEAHLHKVPWIVGAAAVGIGALFLSRLLL